MVEPVLLLIQLVMNMVKDPNVSKEFKDKLYDVAIYVLEDHDIMPESELGVVGLVDDVIKITDVLDEMVLRHSPILRNNWSGKGDVLKLIEHIQQHKTLYLKNSASAPTDTNDDKTETS